MGRRGRHWADPWVVPSTRVTARLVGCSITAGSVSQELPSYENILNFLRGPGRTGPAPIPEASHDLSTLRWRDTRRLGHVLAVCAEGPGSGGSRLRRAGRALALAALDDRQAPTV